MPLFQYFGWVGSFLLAALFAANWCCSVPVARAPRSDVPRDQAINIRIHTDRKWPERVVFGTTRSALTDEAKANAETDIGGSEPPVPADRHPSPRSPRWRLSLPGRVFDRPAPPARLRSGTRRRLGKARHLKIARACR